MEGALKPLANLRAANARKQAKAGDEAEVGGDVETEEVAAGAGETGAADDAPEEPVEPAPAVAKPATPVVEPATVKPTPTAVAPVPPPKQVVVP